MGEFSAVLNGVPFVTGQSDYDLRKPVSQSGEANYHKTVRIDTPPVPPEVQGSVENQILEMRKYFKAWQDQDVTERERLSSLL